MSTQAQCLEPGCDRRGYYSRGLCARCYQRRYKRGDVTKPAPLTVWRNGVPPNLADADNPSCGPLDLSQPEYVI